MAEQNDDAPFRRGMQQQQQQGGFPLRNHVTPTVATDDSESEEAMSEDALKDAFRERHLSLFDH